MGLFGEKKWKHEIIIHALGVRKDNLKEREARGITERKGDHVACLTHLFLSNIYYLPFDMKDSWFNSVQEG